MKKIIVGCFLFCKATFLMGMDDPDDCIKDYVHKVMNNTNGFGKKCNVLTRVKSLYPMSVWHSCSWRFIPPEFQSQIMNESDLDLFYDVSHIAMVVQTNRRFLEAIIRELNYTTIDRLEFVACCKYLSESSEKSCRYLRKKRDNHTIPFGYSPYYETIRSFGMVVLGSFTGFGANYCYKKLFNTSCDGTIKDYLISFGGAVLSNLLKDRGRCDKEKKAHNILLRDMSLGSFLGSGFCTWLLGKRFPESTSIPESSASCLAGFFGACLFDGVISYPYKTRCDFYRRNQIKEERYGKFYKWLEGNLAEMSKKAKDEASLRLMYPIDREPENDKLGLLDLVIETVEE